MSVYRELEHELLALFAILFGGGQKIVTFAQGFLNTVF